MKRKSRIATIVGAALLLIAIGVLVVLPKFTCLLNSCSQFRQSNSEYCSHHTCTLEDCNQQKVTENAYCYIHNCSYDGCGELASSFDNGLNYCQKHQCTVKGCTLGIYINGHCLQHDCVDTYCNEPADEYYSYCSKHSQAH